jgi:hypothetical protein
MVPHMSTLWTPDGERPVGRRSAGAAGDAAQEQPADAAQAPRMPQGEPVDEEMRAQMEELRAQLAKTPASLIIANHAFGLFELAAVHLSEQPPNLEDARLAIDALTALVDGLKGRLGDNEGQLAEGLAQLRLAFVQISAAAKAGPAAGPG